ncbi:MAG TPA: hypothetical protein PLI52_02690, partial [Prochlorococcaceae cyanobacterium AMR_MDS_5431]|nr:hypothetical protein [Prochlorococcaceae cyanobacterium AMR_MDS_5431]
IYKIEGNNSHRKESILLLLDPTLLNNSRSMNIYLINSFDIEVYIKVIRKFAWRVSTQEVKRIERNAFLSRCYFPSHDHINHCFFE